MKLLRVVDRIFIVVDALGKKLFLFFGKKKVSEKTVVIVFQQLYGDAVVIQNALGEYARIFPINAGYRIKLLARPSVAKFMLETLEIPTAVEIEELDFKRFLEEYSYYRQIIKKYRGMIDTLIVPGTSLSAEIFASASDAKRKVGLVRSIDVKKPIIMAIFAKIAYGERIRPKKENMMLQRHRLLINYLGNVEYQAKLPRLLVKDRIISDKHYCVMCPGASKMEKCWPIERFAEVADYIIEKHDLNIHLCGGAEEAKFEQKLISLMKHSTRVVSHIGKTSFSDWSAIVQYADLVVGNDSATMHLAVASRRKAVCIAGVYDKFQFFPYKVDVLEEDDCLPITVLKDMDCEWCRTLGYNAGYGNVECIKRIKQNKCACCIDSIIVRDVIEKIDLLLNRSGEFI